MRVMPIFWPTGPEVSGRLPRKLKKSFKKSLFGFYGTNNFHGIYRTQKQWNKIAKPVSIVIKRGKCLYAFDTIEKKIWKILYTPKSWKKNFHT